MKVKKLARQIMLSEIPKTQLAKEIGVHFQDLLDFERMVTVGILDRIERYFEKEKE